MLGNLNDFFAKEQDCTLLNLDNGYLKQNHTELKQKADGWMRHLGVEPPAGYPPYVKLKPLDRKRIQKYRTVLFRDADRMFKDEGNKERFCHLCDMMWTKL